MGLLGLLQSSRDVSLHSKVFCVEVPRAKAFRDTVSDGQTGPPPARSALTVSKAVSGES